MLAALVARVYAYAHPRIARRFAPYRALRDEILALVAGERRTGASAAPLRVLDLALGSGELARALADAGHAVVGVEPSGVIRRVAARRTAGRANVAVTSTLTDAEPFDVVLSVHALYADPAWRDRLRLALRALRPGGIAILVNFAAPFPVWPTARTVARRDGLRAAATALVWLVPNAIFDRLRRPRTAPCWPQAVFEARVAEIGFDVAAVRRTFLNEASVLIVARRPEVDRRLARVVVYEIAESVRFEATREDPRLWVRKADATIFGTDVVTFEPDPVLTAGSVIVGRASSAVVVPGAAGPLLCTFDVLFDSAPDRPSLDKLMVSASGALEGRLDLRHAAAGRATAEGAWSLAPRSGRFAAAFFIPMKRANHAGYWYVDHDDDGRVTCVDRPAMRPLRADELVLGWPATKIVISIFAPRTTAE